VTTVQIVQFKQSFIIVGPFDWLILTQINTVWC